jgi:hypothetical protein
MRRQRDIGDRERVDVKGRLAIVIDDGIATGATTRGAMRANAYARAQKTCACGPVAPTDTLVAMQDEADEMVCLEDHEIFGARFLPHDRAGGDRYFRALYDARISQGAASRANKALSDRAHHIVQRSAASLAHHSSNSSGAGGFDLHRLGGVQLCSLVHALIVCVMLVLLLGPASIFLGV